MLNTSFFFSFLLFNVKFTNWKTVQFHCATIYLFNLVESVFLIWLKSDSTTDLKR